MFFFFFFGGCSSCVLARVYHPNRDVLFVFWSVSVNVVVQYKQLVYSYDVVCVVFVIFLVCLFAFFFSLGLGLREGIAFIHRWLLSCGVPRANPSLDRTVRPFGQSRLT